MRCTLSTLPLGRLLRLLDQLFRLLEALERHFGLDDTGTHQHITVFIRQREHRSQLIQLCNADLLTYFDLL